MIVFSAFLVVVAVVLLVAGAVTSKLWLVYLAIGVSGVSLLALALGAIIRRRELFGKTQEARHASPPPVAAQVPSFHDDLGALPQPAAAPGGYGWSAAAQPGPPRAGYLPSDPPSRIRPPAAQPSPAWESGLPAAASFPPAASFPEPQTPAPAARLPSRGKLPRGPALRTRGRLPPGGQLPGNPATRPCGRPASPAGQPAAATPAGPPVGDRPRPLSPGRPGDFERRPAAFSPPPAAGTTSAAAPGAWEWGDTLPATPPSAPSAPPPAPSAPTTPPLADPATHRTAAPRCRAHRGFLGLCPCRCPGTYRAHRPCRAPPQRHPSRRPAPGSRPGADRDPGTRRDRADSPRTDRASAARRPRRTASGRSRACGSGSPGRHRRPVS